MTMRKSLRDIGLQWTLHDETLEQAARRLRPRAPEVVLKWSNQGHESVSAGAMSAGAASAAASDLFEGLLVSKPHTQDLPSLLLANSA